MRLYFKSIHDHKGVPDEKKEIPDLFCSCICSHHMELRVWVIVIISFNNVSNSWEWECR